MISKNRLGWLARISFAAFLSLGLIACSDDGDTGDMTPDAMQDQADAPPVCEGHTCEPAGVVALPEGGMLRMEYLHVGNMPDGTRVEAPLRGFLTQFEGQDSYDPAAGDNVPRPFLGPVVAESPTMTCYDQTAHDLFFNAHHPNIQAFVDSRNYYADGPTSILAEAEDPNFNLDFIRTEMGVDPAENVMHANIWLGSGPASALQRNAKYSIAPQAPNGDYPGFVAESGYDIPAGGDPYDGTIGSFLAADFTLDSPTEQEFYNNLQIDQNNDLTFGYTLLDGATIPDNWPTPIWFAGFVSINDYGNGNRPTLDYLCLGEAGRANSNPELVVPSAVFSEAGFPQGGKLITGIIMHTAWALNETHRFDAVAMNCDIGDFTVVAP
jgi:hypothetical protein